jgi:uncharacterized membrane protein
MSKHQTTVIIASYADQKSAEADWEAVEKTAKEGNYLADSAVVVREADGTPKLVDRQSRHGWGKGAIAGAVVGILFPPSILLGAAVGAIAGAGVGRLHRSLGRDKVKNLGDTLDKGDAAVIAVVDTAAVDAFTAALSHAGEVHSEATGLSDDELQAAPAS